MRTALALVLLAATAAHASDVVELTNGRRVHGKIEEETRERVFVRAGGERVVIPGHLVHAVVRAGTAKKLLEGAKTNEDLEKALEAADREGDEKTRAAAKKALEKAGHAPVEAPPRGPDPKQARYGELHLVSLSCGKADDGLFAGGEEPFLEIGPRRLWASKPDHFAKGTFENLHAAPVVFKDVADLELKEQDPFRDDAIGIVLLDPSQARRGNQRFVLENGTSRYELVYRVETPDGRCALLCLRSLAVKKPLAHAPGERETVSIEVDDRPVASTHVAKDEKHAWKGLELAFARRTKIRLRATVEVEVEERSGKSGATHKTWKTLRSKETAAQHVEAAEPAGVKELHFTAGDAEYVLAYELLP